MELSDNIKEFIDDKIRENLSIAEELADTNPEVGVFFLRLVNNLYGEFYEPWVINDELELRKREIWKSYFEKGYII